MASKLANTSASPSQNVDLEESTFLKGMTNNFLKYTNQQIITGETGTRSALVYKGLFNSNIPIALKRYQEADFEVTGSKALKDFEFLSSAANRHPNIIRFFGKAEEIKIDGEESKEKFSYLATELCECSVADIINPARKLKAKQNGKTSPHLDSILPSLPHKEILRQSMEAVSFLHSIDRIHRNLHPDNFLIFCVDPRTEHFIVKLTDFQYSKNIVKNPNHSGTLGKEGWVAPEILEKRDEDQRSGTTVESKSTKMTDAFIMGCYCYYVLYEGKHPFGRGVTDQRSRIGIKTYKVYLPNWDGGSDWNAAIPSSMDEEATWALDMIKDLIKFEASERKSVEDVLLRSKYFQPESYQIYDHPNAKIPGLCVIVTQAMYHNPANDLCWEDYSGGIYPGVNIDANCLNKTFSAFGYDVLSFKNLQADEITKYLSPKELLKMIDTQEKKTAGSSTFKNYASLVVCLIGHGSQGVFIGVDNVAVSLNTIQYDAFDDNACLDLSGKPKVFIVLACQGDKEQKEIKRQEGSVMLPTFPMILAPTTTYVKNEERIPPVFDFIRLMSTIEGYQAFGDWSEGSPFINSLCKALDYEYKELLVNKKDRVNQKEEYEKEEKKILKKSLRKRDLTQLFATFVTPLVGRTIQTPEFRSSLSKTIRFRCIRDPLELLSPAYDGSEQEHFKDAREYNISLGRKGKKLISNSDCTALWFTVDAEARGNDEVQKAIAWVILNRYNSVRDYWGGNKSLEKICKHPGLDKFKIGINSAQNPGKFDKTTLNGIRHWLTYVYGGHDPSLGATNFYFNDNISNRRREELEQTIIIDGYYFYKLC